MTADASLKAFRRAPSPGMSTWCKGIPMSSLATARDTGGAFEFVAARMRKGTEPPPHGHEREHEVFHVLEGLVDVHVGSECLRATAGRCVFLPKGGPHAFRIHSGQVHMPVAMTPGGFMDASAAMAIPARSLSIPPDGEVTDATVDLAETVRVFAEYGARVLAADDIAAELPAYPLPPGH